MFALPSASDFFAVGFAPAAALAQDSRPGATEQLLVLERKAVAQAKMAWARGYCVHCRGRALTRSKRLMNLAELLLCVADWLPSGKGAL